MEGFILETMSVAGLPTDLGGFATAPVGLLCSGLQDKRAVASLYLSLFMAQRRLTGKAWLFRYLLHLLGPPQNRRFCGERRHSGTSEFCRLRRNERCETYADEAKRKAREGAQRQDNIHAPVRDDSTLLYINGVLRGRSP